jgi:hypothetical protein
MDPQLLTGIGDVNHEHAIGWATLTVASAVFRLRGCLAGC